MLKPALEKKADLWCITLNVKWVYIMSFLKIQLIFISLLIWALLFNYCLLTLELFRAHRITNRNLKIALGIFISKWMAASVEIELIISHHKYATIKTNENVNTKYPH